MAQDVAANPPPGGAVEAWIGRVNCADCVPLPEDVPASTPIYFHVRNDGANSDELLELSVVGEKLPSPA